jgi:hypothetical protein
LVRLVCDRILIAGEDAPGEHADHGGVPWAGRELGLLDKGLATGDEFGQVEPEEFRSVEGILELGEDLSRSTRMGCDAVGLRFTDLDAGSGELDERLEKIGDGA